MSRSSALAASFGAIIATSRTRRALALFIAIGATNLARADEIRTKSDRYVDAKVVAVDQGRLQFRTAAGALQSVFLDELIELKVDRGAVFADFNDAERLQAGGEIDKALTRYRRTLRLTEEWWQELISARIVSAADRGGQIDLAVEHLLRINRGRWTGPAAAARLLPRTLPDKLSGRVARAIEALDAALGRQPNDLQSVAPLLLRYEILRAVGDARAEIEAPKVAALAIPESLSCERAFEVVLIAMEQVAPTRARENTLRDLDQAMSTCPQSSLPKFLLMKGAILTASAATNDDWIRAAWPFLRVAIHFSGNPVAADGWFGAALAMERLGKPENAIEMLKECLAVKRVPESLRSNAERALRRLESAKK